MQYKIPVQIENDDPIFLGLSLKQIIILMVGGGIGYTIFTSLSGSGVPGEVAVIPGAIVFFISLAIALFKISEMTFIPFMLNRIRQSINSSPKIWTKGTDSFQPIDIGYITKAESKKEVEIDTSEKVDKIRELNDKLKNI